MATYTQEQAEQKRNEILTTQRARYDNVKIVAIDPADPRSPKRVLARRTDDRTKWEAQ
jgi:hypothetical protein